jgi:hypothetical protein
MESARKPIVANFSEIKRSLDPSFSYVVFEREAGAGEDEPCSENIRLFSRLRKRVIKSDLYLDQRAWRSMLIVTIEAQDAEAIMEDLFEAWLPRDVLYYLLQGVSEQR